MEFIASAPSKAILFGEHYVVYGAPALALPIEPRNKVEFGASDAVGISLASSLGNGKIGAGGKYSGAPGLGPYAEVAKEIMKGEKIPSCSAEFQPAWKLKGVGVSASLCAAFAAGLAKIAGIYAGPSGLFRAAQAGDMLAHGGRASGIDAKIVCEGKPLVFRKKFAPISFDAKQAAFSLPKGSSLIIIGTHAGKKASTDEMVAKFAESFGIRCSPSETSMAMREEIVGEYMPLWKKIEAAMKNPDANGLGKLMDENHGLLKQRGMSSPGIEKAIDAALSAGAYGAKLTGAGGEGGAVLALCSEFGKEKTMGNITSSSKFKCHSLEIAKKGAG